MSNVDQDAFEDITRRMETAWKAGDGAAFAAPFAEDADFVNIRGEHFRGRDTIARGHDEIFRTIYAGSSIVVQSRSIVSSVPGGGQSVKSRSLEKIIRPMRLPGGTT